MPSPQIRPEALEKAAELAGGTWESARVADTTLGRSFARYIADVSEKAKALDVWLDNEGLDKTHPVRGAIRKLILPNPEDDLRQEAREICAATSAINADGLNFMNGSMDRSLAMRCTLAALKKGRG